MPWISGAIVGGIALYGAIDAANKSSKAKKAINKLKKNQPKFRDAADIQAQSEGLVKHGFSAEEAANFQQGLSRANNAQYRLATDRNPNLAPAIQAGINFGNVGAQNQFAAQDAQLRQGKVDRLTAQITGQSNAQTEADIQNKRDMEIAYGNAKNQNDAQLYNSLSMMGAAANLVDWGSLRAKDPNMGGVGYSGSPSMGAQNVPNNLEPAPGSNEWAQSLYGNPNVSPAYPLIGRAPSRYMPAAPQKKFDTTFSNYYIQ